MQPRTGSKITNVNLAKYPPPENIAKELLPNTTISIGDLHANAMKLIYILIQEKVMKFNSFACKNPNLHTLHPSQLYNVLCKIYWKPVDLLTKDDMAIFKDIIGSISFASNAKTSLIRLIGDEVGDRGQNDIFVLLLLKKLKDNQIPVESLYSNHSGELFNACETVFTKTNRDVFSLEEIDPKDETITYGIDNFPLMKGQEHGADKITIRLGDMQGVSLENLGIIIERGLVTKAEVVSLIKDYMPMVKALSYEIDPDVQNGPRFMVASHAPVGIKTIIALAKFFEVSIDSELSKEITKQLKGDKDLPDLLKDMKKEDKPVLLKNMKKEDKLDERKDVNFDPLVIKMAQLIDQINHNFNLLKAETIKALEGKPNLGGVYTKSRVEFVRENLITVGDMGLIESPSFDHPLVRIAWTRFMVDQEMQRNDVRPDQLGKAKMYFIHGHDSPGETKDNVINTDNTIGKADENWQGKMEVYISHGLSLDKILKFQKAQQVKAANATSNPTIPTSDDLTLFPQPTRPRGASVIGKDDKKLNSSEHRNQPSKPNLSGGINKS